MCDTVNFLLEFFTFFRALELFTLKIRRTLHRSVGRTVTRSISESGDQRIKFLADQIGPVLPTARHRCDIHFFEKSCVGRAQ